MKKLILSIVFGLGVVGNLTAMEADESVVPSGNGGQAEESVVQGAKIKVVTSDAQEFEISLELAKKMPTISDLLGDIGEEPEAAIPLPVVSAATFDYVIKLLTDVAVDLKELSIVRLRRIVNALDYLGVRTLQMPLQELALRLQGNIDEFREISSKLHRGLRTLLWRQHPAYKYFFQPHLIKTLKSISVDELSISSDNHTLAITSYRSLTIKLFDINQLDQEPYNLSQQPLGRAAISADLSKFILFRNQKMNVYDSAHPDQPLRSLEYELRDPFVVSSDGSVLISWSSSKKTIKIWDLNKLDQAPRELHNVGVNNLMISSGNKKLVAWDENTITIWNLDTLERVHTLDYQGLSFVELAGNALIAWSNRHGTIKVWNMNNPYLPPQDLDHENVDRVAAGPDGDKLVSSSREGIIKIWNMENTDKLVRQLDDIRIDGFKITQDRLIFSSSMRRTIQVWDFYNLDQGPYVLQPEHQIGLAGVTVSADGSTLVMWTSGSINIWDLIAHNELDNLNWDQIAFMAWLYDNRNEAAMLKFRLSADQQALYQTLPDRLKRSLQRMFPAIAKQPLQEQAPLRKSKRRTKK